MVEVQNNNAIRMVYNKVLVVEDASNFEKFIKPIEAPNRRPEQNKTCSRKTFETIMK